MGVKNPKEKGKYLESKVADYFKKHHNLTKTDVHRAQASGTFQSEYGDLYFRKHHIIIECKNQNVITFKSIFPMTKEIVKFANQLEDEIEKFKKDFPNDDYIAFLVLANTSKRFGPYVLISEDFLQESFPKTYLRTTYNNENYYRLYDAEEFIRLLNIQTFEY